MAPVPFPHAVITDFLPGGGFAERLRAELLDVTLRRRGNDLYHFQQVSHPPPRRVWGSGSPLVRRAGDPCPGEAGQGPPRGGDVPLPRSCAQRRLPFLHPLQSDDLKEKKEPHVSALR